MIDRNHPAVEALADAIYWALSGQYGDFGTPSKGEAHAALTAALPHLTADDLRQTEAGQRLLADGWTQAVDFLWAEACAIDAWEYSDARIANPYREETPNE